MNIKKSSNMWYVLCIGYLKKLELRHLHSMRLKYNSINVLLPLNTIGCHACTGFLITTVDS
jgi:hypothetical protein